MPRVKDDVDELSSRRTREAWEPKEPGWQLISDPGTTARKLLMLRLAYALPVILFAIWLSNAALHSFEPKVVEIGIAMTCISLLLSRFLHRRSRGLPAQFGTAAITEKSSSITIDSAEVMSIVCGVGFVCFAIAMLFA